MSQNVASPSETSFCFLWFILFLGENPDAVNGAVLVVELPREAQNRRNKTVAKYQI